MSALSAVIAIRRYIGVHPGVLPDIAATAIRKNDADLAANDFDTGLVLHAQLPIDILFEDPSDGMRRSLRDLIEKLQPWWIRGLPHGRERLLALLEQNEAQCFKAAGLLEDPPSQATVLWWDDLAQWVRARINDQLLTQGREAELLSLEYERKRLAHLGINREPRWTSIEDNGAGYDIISYDLGQGGSVNRLIEVKSSKQKPPRIILTRGEWEAAKKFGPAYHFHIWKLPEQHLLQRTVQQVELHIPQDRGAGEWTHVEITISGNLDP
jgi:hypothetical protein